MRFLKTKNISDDNIKVNIFVVAFNSALFTGYIPAASGTFGSAFALLFFLIPGFGNVYVLGAASLICFLTSLATSKNILLKYGDDPSVIVIDEVIGMWITVFTFYILSGDEGNPSIISMIILFILFRFFDIVKFQPARYFDKMKNIFGVLMDDVISGVYAGLISYLIIFLINKLK
jgi:phosphatidylglycerophosphatase A